MQGRLREKPVSVLIRTKCAYTSEPIVIEIDSELKYRIVEGGKNPLVFVPHVDFGKLADPSIMEWYRYGGHLEKRVIETKLLEV